MLRTNIALLSYVQQLYEMQPRRADIVLKEFPKGRLLLEQGDKLTKVMIIVEGITKCFFMEENGKEFVVEFLGQGEILGEIEVIRDINCLCSIEALIEGKAFFIDVTFFRTLLDTDVRFSKLLMQSFADRIIHTSRRSSKQQLYTVEQSLGQLLSLQSDYHSSISKEDMAAYLGITIRSLNRALKKIK
jgi:CRP-like cAMP-binding protein